MRPQWKIRKRFAPSPRRFQRVTSGGEYKQGSFDEDRYTTR